VTTAVTTAVTATVVPMDFRSMARAMAPLPLILSVGFAACAGTSDGQPDPAGAGDLSDVTHFVEPTDQMRAAAEQQCRNDPELAQGYVKAVSPDTEEIVAEITLDCDDVRGDG
jgi:hypothetical protein